ncbi:YibE/F family protein [Sedimentibacter hydroxybenzoicus DSM 7310]|uniref:YibE/F family protein n=1 Tax=Sedimentibacter hydroxybenzoicus DSM 7310 TaxID=1123245 RepID=A0A974GY97_SEDHY|nr:YibE/F family protein [Sedimentibacter hydroxybenzoicus]NYB76000.1 YibE/F family protein [Sedimentibacter hydroxybenzoicus DSM 7310]
MLNFKLTKSTVVYTITLIISVLFITTGYRMNKLDLFQHQDVKTYKAEVLAINEITEEEIDYGYELMTSRTVRFTARLNDKNSDNSNVEAFQYIDESIEINPKEIEIGDAVLIAELNSRTNIEETEWTFIEYQRINSIIKLTIIFFAMLILICRKKGINTIISLTITFLSIFMVFIPSILNGRNIYISSIVICVFIILSSLLIIHGVHKKTLCAIIGNLGGLATAGILSYVISNMLNLTGMIDQDSMFLLMINPENPLNLKAILWSGIVIGSLGAVMDISMSISSAVNELAENIENKKFNIFLKSGINIGQDSIGTMTNTLVLAYIGSSLSVVLLMVVYNNDLLHLLNLEMIIYEFLQAIIGSMGLLFAIPITSLFSAYIFSK